MALDEMSARRGASIWHPCEDELVARLDGSDVFSLNELARNAMQQLAAIEGVNERLPTWSKEWRSLAAWMAFAESLPLLEGTVGAFSAYLSSHEQSLLLRIARTLRQWRRLDDELASVDWRVWVDAM